LPIAEGFGKAREAAERALQLAPDLAEAHAALGEVLIFYDWEWHGADVSLRRALELAPGNARIMRSTAILAALLGRLDETIALLQRAAALDPLGVPVHRSLGRWCYCAGRLEEAEAAIRTTLELNPHGDRLQHTLGLVRLQQGRLDEALEAFQQERYEALRLLGIALAQHARGLPAESYAALKELTDTDAAGSAYQIAEGHAYRDEADLAFQWMERAYAQHDPGLISMKVDPLLRRLHDDPRWQPFLEKMGLAA
jgi:serine/threonine-protein kinase